MKLLLDINVLLDVSLHRTPWVAEAAPLLTAVDEGRATGYVSGHTITTAYYVLAKNQGVAAARTQVAEFLRFLEVVPVERADLFQALLLGVRDFEDAVQAVCGLKVGADYIVTRDLVDFQGLQIPARTPADVLRLL